MTFTEISRVLAELCCIVLIIGFGLGWFLYSKIDALHKSIFVYLSLMLSVDIAGRLCEHYLDVNAIMFPIFSFIELSFFIYFYNKCLFKKPNKLLIGLGCVALIYIVAEFLQYFVFNTLDLKQFQPYCKIADNFVIIVMALVFYYQKINSFNETKWANFRLNTAVLIYFTINTVIFIPFNFIINETIGVRLYIWTINVVIILLFYSYLTILIWKNGRRAIAKSQESNNK